LNRDHAFDEVEKVTERPVAKPGVTLEREVEGQATEIDMRLVRERLGGLGAAFNNTTASEIDVTASGERSGYRMIRSGTNTKPPPAPIIVP